MPRHVVYTLLTKKGPTHEQQMATVRRAVKLTTQDETYTDDLTKRRRIADHEYPARATMIRQLRRGDVVVVASPGRFAIGRAALRAALHELARKDAPLLDASTGKRVLWTDEIADHLDFLDRGASEHTADILRGARAAKKASGIVYRPEKKRLPPNAEAVWRDTVRYTREEAAAECGVTWRTLHNRFMGRTEPMGTRPSKVKSRRRN